MGIFQKCMAMNNFEPKHELPGYVIWPALSRVTCIVPWLENKGEIFCASVLRFIPDSRKNAGRIVLPLATSLAYHPGCAVFNMHVSAHVLCALFEFNRACFWNCTLYFQVRPFTGTILNSGTISLSLKSMVVVHFAPSPDYKLPWTPSFCTFLDVPDAILGQEKLPLYTSNGTVVWAETVTYFL